MLGSANISGSPAMHFMTGNLSYQIEHHLFPDLPTIGESGVPGFAIDNWYSFIAPAGTPSPIVDTLNVEIARTLSLPDVKERLHVLGIVPFTTARPAEFAQYLRAEIAKYAKLVKAVGITPE